MHPQRSQRLRAAAQVLALALLSSCAAPPPPAPPPPAQAPPPVAYVLMDGGDRATVRAIVSGACPQLSVDGARVPMTTRVAAQTPAARPGQGKASAFPESVCEAPLPPGAAAAAIDGVALPVPRASVQRIVIIGDTGCRIKAADKVFQDCSSPAAWPFAALADAAAAEHPDLVVHVGDYHYRETACPPALGCASSPWGYGWDAWNADFFVPARPLLLAAPWIVARGNHEECARAGQGWFRLLDPRAYRPERSCDRPEDDADADVSDPYAVALGGNWQIVVFDSAKASRPLNSAKPREARILAHYQRQMGIVKALADRPGMHSFFLSHHPVLGFAVVPGGAISFGNPGLLAAMQAVNGSRYFPAGVDAALHGHVHTFEAIDFASDHPATIVAGHGGDKLDPEVPPVLDASYAAAPPVQIDFAAHSSAFGYLVMERHGEDWDLRARGLDGAQLARCTLHAGHLACTSQEPLSRPAGQVPPPHA